MSKSAFYRTLVKQAEALISDETNTIANLANVSALLFMSLEDINWAGFYLLDKTASTPQLVLGPFQGKPACVRINVGQGVCGTAVAENKTQLVADVNTFAGHIACDAASRSEIVIVLKRQGEIIGVLDIDSPSLARFDEHDQQGLEQLIACLESQLT